MDDRKWRMVDYLDEPERILCFTLDEFLAVMVPMGVGIGTHHLGAGLFAGAGLYVLLHKLNTQAGNGVLQRLLYWHLPRCVSRTRAVPGACWRYWIG